MLITPLGVSSYVCPCPSSRKKNQKVDRNVFTSLTLGGDMINRDPFPATPEHGCFSKTKFMLVNSVSLIFKVNLPGPISRTDSSTVLGLALMTSPSLQKHREEY